MIPRFRRGRELAGLSLLQASRMLELSPDALVRIESGIDNHVLEGFVRIMADLYGVTTAWLLGYPPSLPESAKEMLRDDRLSFHDRDVIRETLEAWYTVRY